MISVTIPSSVATIGSFAFSLCSSLNTVTIPSNVTSIGMGAFSNIGTVNVSITDLASFCNNQVVGIMSERTSIIHLLDDAGIEIKDIVIPDGVTSINESAFRNCSNLKSVIIPNSVTTIGQDAFQGCSGLTTLTIPSSVASIEANAFQCRNLTSVTAMMRTPVNISSYTFSNRKAILYVPFGCKTAYEAANEWKEFKEIVELEEEIVVTDISQLDNAIYVEPLTAQIGSEATIDICLKNASAATAYVFDLVLPKGITVAKNAKGKYMDELSDRHDDHTRTFNDRGNNVYSLSTLSGNSEELTGNDGAIRLVTLSITDDIAEGTYAIDIKNASYSKPDGTLVTLPDTRSVIILEDYILGDVNGNDGVDIGDAVSVVNFLVGKESQIFVEKAADTNKNGQVDIGDAVTIVNYLVGKTASLSRIPRSVSTEREPQ